MPRGTVNNQIYFTYLGLINILAKFHYHWMTGRAIIADLKSHMISRRSGGTFIN